ncbi:ESPR-type extended signal peptide-containing protein [Snodgrassella alvi]|uniref:ESPR-type extended signal peptide-containing protein n=1 Tax=Snodgrassella alvi TaxID=1196083 RepID=UPI000C1EC60D|nr:ESPR-type extended signal peptide-containing protein [Snodgrassella alvi]PIT13666.1 hypothetical protein BGI33_09345 [Snodgrassella alvi]PIT18183.1 hypothetical protein BGI34_05590 [Snodgrassella alvi]
MNKVYRVVWNEHTQTWVAVSELANSKTKSNTVCELPLVKRILNMFGLKKIVSLTLTTLILQLQAISPVYAANLAITGTTNASTNGTGVSYAFGSHGSIALAGDDDYCGADKVNGRRNITTGGISAMDEYLRFAENRSFNGRNPYGVSNGQQVWTGDGATGGITTGSSGYMGTPTGGDTNRLPVAYGVYSFASGCGSYATGNYSTAFGNNATATAGGAQAFGVAALASGATAVAIGVGAQATNTASLALGSVATSDGAGSVAVGFNSAAQKDNATALGANAMAIVEKAVALGSDSLANTSSGIQGYDPAGTNTDAVNQSATWKSTIGAVAIGNTSMQLTRQITGLAAGTADTDAVNVAQLKNLASSTSTGLSSLSTAILRATDLTSINNSINTLQQDALQWNGTAYDASHGTANAQKIVKVAAGDVSENSTDAVNAGQLFSLSSSTSTSVDSLSTTLRNAGDLSNVNNNINSLNNSVSNLQKDALQWNGTAYDAGHGTANAQKIVKVAAGDVSENSTDAVNAGQLFSLSSSTSTSVESLSTTLRNAGDLSNVNTNINSLSSSLNTANSSISSLNNNVSNLQKDALQWNGIAYDASHGTTTAQKITNVAAGSISENSTDAVNAGQLFSLSSSTSTSVESLSTTLRNAGDLSNVNTNINSLSSSLNTANSSISSLNNNVSNLQKDALQWNGSAYDASHGSANAQKITHVAAGNVTENSTDAINGGQLYSLSDSTMTNLLNLSTAFSSNLYTGLSTANSRIDTVSQSTATLAGNLSTAVNSISTLQKDALQWNGTAYDASHGTANAQKITKVAAGDITANSTDAVNAGQLFSLSSSTSTSVESLSTTLRNAGDLSNVNNNINSLTNNVSNLQKDALQWNGTAYDASHGTANAQKIVKVAAGDVSENSTDAVNGGQLYSLSDSTMTSLHNLSTAFSSNLYTGLSTANSRIDTVSQSTATLTSNLSTAVSSISTLQKDTLQWNGTAYDASHGTTTAQKIIKVAAGDVSENSTDAVNAGQLFSLSSSTSTSVESLSTTLRNAGDLSNVNNSISSLTNSVSNLQKDALQWNGTAYDASHGTANAQKIIKVAAGDISANSTDAVNGGQLYSLSSSAMTGLDNLSTAFSDSLSTGLNTANSRIDTVSQSTATLAGNLSTAVNSISTLQKDALQWNGTAYDASHGTANAQRIINVANGNIGENSTDAINGGQLYSISSSIFSSVSSSVENVVNENKINMDAVNRDLKTAQSALQTAQNDIQTAQTDIQTSKKLIEELQKNAVHFDDDDAGSSSFFGLNRDTSNERTISNIANGRVDATSNQAVNGRQLYALSTSTSTSLSSLQDQLNLASGNIPAGLSSSLSTLLTDALQWNGNAYDASHHSGSPQKITNLAVGDIGEHSTDAVNGSQLWQMKNDFKQDLQNLSDSFDNKLAQNNSGSTAAINAATDKANQAMAKADSLSTSTAKTLSEVASSLGGNASYNAETGSFTAPSYSSTAADGTALTANNVGDALSNLYNGGSKYAKVNSTLSAASASGNNAIAIGGAATASGNAAVAIGAEAKASAADGVAIGNHASVTQSGGVALGANSVANTAGGIMGYIPAGATAQQARAIQATTSTEAAVSVGDASKGIYRQITGVAAGTEDSDAVNVAQLKGVNARIENINRYVNNVNDRIQHVERRAYSGTALAMALSGAYLPQLNAGEQTVGVGMGSYHGYTAVGINYKATNNSGKFSWGAGVSTTGHETGFNAGIGYKW